MTELIWEGKYSKDGQRVAPLRVALPFQTAETVNESAQERQEALDLFGRGGHDTDWRNRLIWGDKKYVLSALLGEFAGKVDLIYIDPPFATGADFSFPVRIDGEEFTKEPSMIELKAYRDTWGKGLDGYLQWFYETVLVLRDLLSESGSLYVHLDWHVGHYAKLVLDEVFSAECLVNEVIWHYQSGGRQHDSFSFKHDTLLLYGKTPRPFFDVEAVGVTRGSEKRNNMKRGQDPDGRMFWSIKSAGKIYKYYDDEKLTPPDVWTDVSHLQQKDPERTGYPTQKPEKLIERVIKASCPADGIVADPFVGGGTTAVVAEKLGRRWIAADLSRFSIHTTRKRLLSVPNVRPFVVQNLGKYERQLWQAAEFGEAAEARTRAYQHFILELFKAQPLEGYAWLHGVKQGRMVHVGSVDAPVTVGDIKQIAGELAKAVGTGRDAPTTKAVDVLGWDFAFDMNEQARQTAGRAGIVVRFWRIPREVLDKRAIEQGDVRFFELAALSVDVEANGRNVTLNLKNFVIPLDDVPEEIQRAITDWSQWIDYWAVDWNNKGDAFHNEWQTYRTKQSPKLEKSVAHEYEAAGEYQVVVKVIDILGNDTTKLVAVAVA